MPYPALPGRHLAYDNDGTVVATKAPSGEPVNFSAGLSAYLSGAEKIELNDDDWVSTGHGNLSQGGGIGVPGNNVFYLWFFCPEQREWAAIFAGFSDIGWLSLNGFTIHGSNDTTNGADGTWEVASVGSGGASEQTLDAWRATWATISFTGSKRVIRIAVRNYGGGGQGGFQLCTLHLYAKKAAGQTPDDIIFIDQDAGTPAEFTSDEDFGDRPLGTTVTRQFRVKNVSPTKTANNINLQCNDADFTIGTTSTGPWVTSIDIASLLPGAESATMWTKDTTPAPGNLLGPRLARIVCTVGSFT